MNNLNQSPPPSKKKNLRIFVHNNWSIQKNANTYMVASSINTLTHEN